MAGTLTKITDANGKEITVDMSKICDINGDVNPDSPASAMDSKRNRVEKVHDIEYVDCNGNVIDNIQILNDMQAGKVNVTALDLAIEATHSGPNHNYCIYYEDSMEKDAETFVNPFKKPILKNHNDWSGEPMGRIQQAWHGASELTDDRSAIHLKVRVTDQDAIPKFLDGRYATVSIGGTMGTVTCNICGKTILKDGKFKFCGHWRGESYKNQMCYWGAKDITYHEVSTVNNPADDFAQIMKVTVITDKDNKEGTDMAGTPGKDAKADEVKKSVCDMIDKLLGKTTDVTDADITTDTADNADVNDGTADNGAQENTQVQDGQQQNADTDMAKKLEDTENALNEANAKLEDANKQLQEANDSIENLKKELQDAKNEAADAQDMSMKLAQANKEMTIDSIIAREKAAGSLKDDAVDSRREELQAKSMKDLNKIMEEQETADSQQQRKPASIQNPGLANTSGDSGKTNDSNGAADTNTADGKAKRTLDDFAKDIVSKLYK